MREQSLKENTMRLFVAISVPRPVAEELEKWTLAHKDKLPFRKWTQPRDYHITLQFLGETTAAQFQELQSTLKEVRSLPLSLAWDGIGTFGPPKSPRVLWGAVSGDLEGLSALYGMIIAETRKAGFEPEDRPYSPHITLARGFAGGGEGKYIEALPSAPAVYNWEADGFVLMRTHMHASPMYEIIGSFPLTSH
ncbi:RNA 2',3'-cyclic phosphodiesterase [Paenibacillus sp. LHD-38]|uniref:RNA 2',3'-cyclic phosphodiesterase n=1 Tax=Paenibacillus sp. LHD-38 TaxID=3072143 RepID=UPI00280CBD82|nr:RNA 2',3'-cyclic phosphodiesterase [Paenibacillus sp. LHD-38]MDQ8734368.1 RNA 2',3'-cyclic phosphodiesterase [Paenibacillus sp. LHD-38]